MANFHGMDFGYIIKLSPKGDAVPDSVSIRVINQLHVLSEIALEKWSQDEAKVLHAAHLKSEENFVSLPGYLRSKYEDLKNDARVIAEKENLNLEAFDIVGVA